MRRRFAIAGIVLVTAACAASQGEPTVTDVRITEPAGPNAAIYLTASGVDDVLFDATVESDVGRDVEFHLSKVDDNGVMTMEPVASAEIPPGGDLVLEPGGLHLMVIDAGDLQIGDVVTVTLIWERYGPQTIEASVVSPGDVMGDS